MPNFFLVNYTGVRMDATINALYIGMLYDDVDMALDALTRIYIGQPTHVVDKLENFVNKYSIGYPILAIDHDTYGDVMLRWYRKEKTGVI